MTSRTACREGGTLRQARYPCGYSMSWSRCIRGDGLCNAGSIRRLVIVVVQGNLVDVGWPFAAFCKRGRIRPCTVQLGLIDGYESVGVGIVFALLAWRVLGPKRRESHGRRHGRSCVVVHRNGSRVPVESISKRQPQAKDLAMQGELYLLVAMRRRGDVADGNVTIGWRSFKPQSLVRQVGHIELRVTDSQGPAPGLNFKVVL